LCLVKTKSTFEINNLKKRDVTMHAIWLGEITIRHGREGDLMKNLWVVVWKSSVVFGMAACLCGTVPSAFAQDAAQEKQPARMLPAYTVIRPAPAADAAKVQSDIAASGKSNMSSLPLFTYQVTSSREDNSYSGVMVGANPFQGGGVSETPTFIIPLIFVVLRRKSVHREFIGV
jgi:hypothetical protein